MHLDIPFTVVDGCPIKLDIYPSNLDNSPAVLIIHGGALIWGSRKNISPEQTEIYRRAGFTVFSIDYRLAPESKLPSIAEDIRTALQWVRSEGLSYSSINPDRIAVVGHSAGAYLGLLSGSFACRPKAIVSFYGYGEIGSDWYGKPSEFYCGLEHVSRSEALAAVGTSAITEGARDRFRFYLHCRQHGTWLSNVLGSMDEQLVAEHTPLHLVDSTFPPTLLLHGDQDTDVPFEQAVLMEMRLRDVGVPHRLLRLEGKGHAFDRDMSDPRVINAFNSVVDFLKAHV